MATANAVLKGIKSRFIDLMQTVYKGIFDGLYTEVDSASNNEVYYIATSSPTIRKNMDTVQFSEYLDKNYTVNNDEFSVGLKEDRNRMEDSKEYLSNSVEMEVKRIADKWKRYNDKLVSELLRDGQSTTLGLSFDGVVTYTSSATRGISVGSSGILTSFVGTGVATTTDLMADYATAKTRLMSFKDSNEEPFNPNPELVVVVPPGLHDYFRTFLSPGQTILYTTSGGSMSNLYMNDAKIVVNYYSTNNSWYLFNAAQPSFVIQNREAPKFFTEDNPVERWVKFFMKSRKGKGYLGFFNSVAVTTAT